MVNGMPNCKAKVATLSYCQKHQLSIVVISTCGLFLIGLLIAMYYMDSKYYKKKKNLLSSINYSIIKYSELISSCSNKILVT